MTLIKFEQKDTAKYLGVYFFERLYRNSGRVA